MSDSDSANALSAPVTLNRGGEIITFPKIAPVDRLKLRSEFRLHRKMQLLQTLALAGVSGLDVVRVLNEFDAKRLKESEVAEWLNDLEGQRVAVKLSLSRLGKKQFDEITDDQVDALALSDSEMLTVAAGVCNVPLVSEKEGDLPLTGGASGATGTGGETPTSSAPTSGQAQTQ